jgi:pilus assembly protein CpaB
MRRLLPIIVILAIVAIVVALVVFSQQPTPPPVDPNVTGDPGQTNFQQSTVDPLTLLPTATPYEFVEVVIAVQQIPRGTRIEANAVDIRAWPAEFQPIAAYSNPEDVIGKIARTDIFREEPILQPQIVDPLEDGALTNLASVGSDAAAVIPKGKVAVALPMDRLTSVAYAIQPGDYVDLMASFLFVDVDRSFQTIEPNIFQMIAFTCESGGAPPCPSNETITFNFSTPVRGTFDTRLVPGAGTFPVFITPSEEPRPRLATQRTIQDALVIWTGDFPADGALFRPAATPTPIEVSPTPEGTPPDAPPPPTPVPPRPDIVTLAVSQQDAVVITYMVEAKIPLTFALRSAGDHSGIETQTVSLEVIMNRFQIEVPQKFEYNIEPAIRSIRQLSAGGTISLQGADTTTP